MNPAEEISEKEEVKKLNSKTIIFLVVVGCFLLLFLFGIISLIIISRNSSHSQSFRDLAQTPTSPNPSTLVVQTTTIPSLLTPTQISEGVITKDIRRLKTNPQDSADAKNKERSGIIQGLGTIFLQYKKDNNGQWPDGIPLLENISTDINGFDKSSGNPDCYFSAVTDLTHIGCEWLDDATLVPQLKPRYIISIPMDTLPYPHYFIALTPDRAHIVIMSDSMNIEGKMTNPTKSSIYVKTF